MKTKNALLLLHAILILMLGACTHDAHSDNTQINSDILHNLQLTDLQRNEMLSFSELTKGEKPSLVFFFSRGCDKCEKQLDRLVGVKMKEYAEKYEIYAISVDEIELSHLPFHQQNTTLKFYEYDQSNLSPYEFIEDFVVPLNMIFDKDGSMVFTKKGRITDYELKAAI